MVSGRSVPGMMSLMSTDSPVTVFTPRGQCELYSLIWVSMDV